MESIIEKIRYKLKQSEDRKYSVYLSVVIPMFNTEKYLQRCLDSIVGQSFKEIFK